MHLITVKHLVQNALRVLPNSSDPFVNVDFIQSDRVFNLSLASANLQAQAAAIPKNLSSANFKAAEIRLCAVAELARDEPTRSRSVQPGSSC